MKANAKFILSQLACTVCLLAMVFGQALNLNLFHYLPLLVGIIVATVCTKTYARELVAEKNVAVTAEVAAGLTTPAIVYEKKRRSILLTYGFALFFSVLILLFLRLPQIPMGARIACYATGPLTIVVLCVVSLRRISQQR